MRHPQGSDPSFGGRCQPEPPRDRVVPYRRPCVSYRKRCPKFISRVIPASHCSSALERAWSIEAPPAEPAGGTIASADTRHCRSGSSSSDAGVHATSSASLSHLCEASARAAQTEKPGRSTPAMYSTAEATCRQRSTESSVSLVPHCRCGTAQLGIPARRLHRLRRGIDHPGPHWRRGQPLDDSGTPRATAGWTQGLPHLPAGGLLRWSRGLVADSWAADR